MSDAAVYVLTGIYLIGIAFGLRGCIRTTRRYFGVRPRVGRDSELVLGDVVVSWIIWTFAAYIGFLSLRRGMGFAPIDWTPVVSTLFAILCLFIPTYLDVILTRVARGRRR